MTARLLNVDELPYLTADIAGIGGKLKTRCEDFRVEEIPLYEPCGEGTHVYFRIEKTNLATMRAVEEIAAALGRSSRDFGYAGLKDAQAVTVQTFSLEHIDPELIRSLSLPRIRIFDLGRHTNKLKLGHLAGNRFTIRIRQVDTARLPEVQQMLEALSSRGVPNYFGPQRFGLRGDTWEIGRAVLNDDYDQAVSVMLGSPCDADYGEVREARALFAEGRYEEAADAWPYPFRNEIRMCRAMAKNKGDARRSFRVADKKLRRFYISAYQSQLFNQVVAQRLESLDRLEQGDLAWRHPQGAVFLVEDVTREQPRCDEFEISPTGPLFGYKMRRPQGPSDELEQTIIQQQGMTPDDWRESGKHRVKGGRRPLRFQPRQASATAGEDDLGPFIEVQFMLEAGCYATTVLREICKTDEANIGDSS
jgi:tRNA pseudouridine13 synthase